MRGLPPRPGGSAQQHRPSEAVGASLYREKARFERGQIAGEIGQTTLIPGRPPVCCSVLYLGVYGPIRFRIGQGPVAAQVEALLPAPPPAT